MKQIIAAGAFALAGLTPLRAQSLTEIVPQDKQKHFAVGVCLSGISYITAYDQYFHSGLSNLESHRRAMWWSIGVPVAAGLLKEAWDSSVRNPGWTIDDSVGDFLVTSFGAVTVTISIDSLSPGRNGTKR